MIGRARPAPPDYVGMGAIGPRNRWWQSLLTAHPQVESRAPRKMGLGYFGRFCTRPMTSEDVDAYHEHFRRKRGRFDGEWTQRYLFDPWVAPLLARAAPDAKVLVMLPDPVERYRRKLAVPRPDVSDHDKGYWMDEVAARGHYATQLRHLWNYVDRSRVLVLQYERCVAAPREQFARTLDFLGLDPWAPEAGWEPPEPEFPMAPLWGEIAAALRDDLLGEALELSSLVEDVDLDLWPALAELREAA